MPSPKQRQYLELHTQWMFTRELHGYLENGTMRLSDEGECEFATPMSDLWYTMTDAEQDELEVMLVAYPGTPEGPVDCGWVDTIPQSGSMPRIAV